MNETQLQFAGAVIQLSTDSKRKRRQIDKPQVQTHQRAGDCRHSILISSYARDGFIRGAEGLPRLLQHPERCALKFLRRPERGALSQWLSRCPVAPGSLDLAPDIPPARNRHLVCVV